MTQVAVHTCASPNCDCYLCVVTASGLTETNRRINMDLNQFFIAGINYKKTDASIRGQFAVSPDQYAVLLQQAAEAGVQEVFVLSTCNRTEIFGVASQAKDLVQLLCSVTVGSIETFNQLSYIKQGNAAAEHLFAVAAGLDSQILGDYEIVGQIKQAVKISRQYNFIGTFLERLTNIVLQSSRLIKNQTALSGGTVSVSFAAIHFLKERVADIKNKKIVLLGTGKIGRNTCKNIIDYLGTNNITLINRTEEKAEELALELNLQWAPFEHLYQQVQLADVVIVATHAEEPVITKAQLLNSGRKVLIDLSIPNNVDPSAKQLPHITLVNVDELSKMNDATLQKRRQEVPKAKAIITEYMAEFKEWCQMRKNVPVLKAAKQKLMDMHECNLFQAVHPNVDENTCINHADSIQKVINTMATKMREQRKPGCNYIEAINDFITSRRAN